MCAWQEGGGENMARTAYLSLSAFVVAVLQQCAFAHGPELHRAAGNINEYVDNTLALMRPAMHRNGFDPFPVDDMAQDFWFKFLFINYTGTIELRNGWLRDLSTIHRQGDATAKYDRKMVTLNVDLVVDSLAADFDYSARLFDIGPSGQLSACIRKQNIRFSILVDFERIVFDLQNFELTDNKEVKLRVTGLGLVDPLVNIVVDALTAVFKNSVVSSIGKQIREALEENLHKLPPLLPPPPPPSKNPEDFVRLLLTELLRGDRIISPA